MTCRTVIFLILAFLLSTSVQLRAAEKAGSAVHPWASSMGAEILGHTAAEKEVLEGHPRVSYENVKDIDAMAETIRKARPGQSFSRDWWKWDRLLTRYIDNGRKDKNTLKILRAVFVGGIFDRYHALEAKGEGDLLYIFFMTREYPRETEGYPRFRGPFVIDGRKIFRELHGGGGLHAGWGGAARMRIYKELAKQGILTQEEKNLFKKLVYQGFSKRFIDFNAGSQDANNHCFGSVGGIAIALQLFPDVPQAKEARAWLNRIWGKLTEFGDWKEFAYYPYGAIFLHGFVDYADDGKLKSDKPMIYAIGKRCQGFVSGGGIKGLPNGGGVFVNENREDIYRNPWQNGNYGKDSVRDGHFWYRMTKIFKDPEFLWAAEQAILGGRGPDGKVPPEYTKAYNERFEIFNDMGIEPKVPAGGSTVGYLSTIKHKIPERLYLRAGRQSGKPFASYFIYDGRGGHLVSGVAGRLYEYSADGAKFLHSSGKYNGRGSYPPYDMLLVMKPGDEFPVNCDDPAGRVYNNYENTPKYLPNGKLVKDSISAQNKKDDCFGQFTYTNYFGSDNRWTRQTVLTAEGYLVVRDLYEPGKSVDGFQAGPCWLLRPDGKWTEKPNPNVPKGYGKFEALPVSKSQERCWFDAPAWDHAWWQKKSKRVLVYIHPAEGQSYGVVRHDTSPDISRAIPTNNSFARAIVKAGKPKVFLSVLVPHNAAESVESVVKQIKTTVDTKGKVVVTVGGTIITIDATGLWNVIR